MLALIYPAGMVTCVAAGGGWPWALLAFNIALVPITDHVLRALAPDCRPSERMLDLLFAPWIFAAYFVAQLGALIFVLIRVSEGDLTAFEVFGLASATGIMTGTAGITAAHELIHRRSRVARGLGLGLLGMTSYMHFRLQHVYGHHREVGTADDPGTAKLGESFPRYLLRALNEGIASSWRIESLRMRRQGRATLSPSNRFLVYAVLQALIYGVIGLSSGWVGVLFFLLQSFVAVHLLEAVNYVQHYGLRREIRAGGSLPAVAEADAWDSDYRLSELLIFNLSRHACHHLHAATPCQKLRVMHGSPKLPYSFFLMVFLALFPPIWMAIMDPRVLALNSGKPVFYYGRPGGKALHTGAST